jgi:hypothetical protein
MDNSDTRTSIRVVLPRQRCGQVRDVVEVLAALEDVYNHLYAWHELAGSVEGDGEPHDSRGLRSLSAVSDPRDIVPPDRRLCLARIEVEPPPFVEIVGARYPLEVIYTYLCTRDGQRDHRSARTIERIEAVREEIDHLWDLSLPQGEIQEAVSTHVIAPFKRLERLDGIEVYEGDDLPKRMPARRASPERATVPITSSARGH